MEFSQRDNAEYYSIAIDLALERPKRIAIGTYSCHFWGRSAALRFLALTTRQRIPVEIIVGTSYAKQLLAFPNVSIVEADRWHAKYICFDYGRSCKALAGSRNFSDSSFAETHFLLRGQQAKDILKCHDSAREKLLDQPSIRGLSHENLNEMLTQPIHKPFTFVEY